MTRNNSLTWITAAAVLAGCADQAPFEPSAQQAVSLSAQPAPIDIAGSWSYVETSVLVLKPEGDVINMTCLNPEGVLTIIQDGAVFTGTLTHAATTCATKDGQAVPPPWPLPYEAVLSGRISGRSIHIDQFDAPPGPPVHCPKTGVIHITDGAAVELSTTGRCDLSFLPFPATARNSASATRL